MALSVLAAYMGEVQTILLDPNGQYWTTAYLVSAHNIITTAIIGENPSALVKVVPNFQLIPGVDQMIPSDQQPYPPLGSPQISDGVIFIRAPSNTTGQRIRQVTAEALQEDVRNWYGEIPQSIVRHIVFDPVDPLRFRVEPPNDGSGQINLTYAYAPPDILTLNDAFNLTEAYRMDYRNGVLGMAYALNTDRQDLAKSEAYLNRLEKNIATKIVAQQKLTSKVGSPQTTE